MMHCLLLIGAFVGLSSVAPQDLSQTAPELSRVPADAAVVVHFQAAKLYASPALKDLRQLLPKAGLRAMLVFEERFLPAPEAVERATLVLMSPKFKEDDEERPFAFMITTRANVKPADVLERLDLIKALPVLGSAIPTWVEEGDWHAKALMLPNPNLIIYGTKNLVWTLATAPKEREIPAALRGLDQSHLGIFANTKALPAWYRELLHSVTAPIGKVDTVRVTAMLQQQITIDIELNYNAAEDAALAESALNELIRKRLAELEKPRQRMLELLEKPKTPRPSTWEEMPEALGTLLGLAALNQAEEILKNSPIKRQGNRLTSQLKLPAIISPSNAATALFGSSLWTMAANRVTKAAQPRFNVENLKQIHRAIHNYDEVHGHLPVDIVDPKTGKPLLSWRVAILPFLGERALYRQFKLTESWDGEHNLKLAKTLVTVFQALNQKSITDAQGHCLTHYMVFTGKESLFPADKKHTFADILDGSFNTILCAEAKSPCVWTKPQDLPLQAEKDLPPLDSVVGLTPAGFHALFCDGVVWWFPMDIDRTALKRMIMPVDGIPFEFPKSGISVTP